MNRYCTLDTNIINTLHMLKEAKIDEAKINGYNVVVDSDRYDNFYAHGLKCAECGLEATHAAIEKEKNAKHYHINFYGIRNEKEVQLTKDHIYPRAMGGFDILENYQVLCEACNSRKKDHTDLTIMEAVAKGYTSYEYALLMQEIKEKKKVNAQLARQLDKQRKLVVQLGLQAAELRKGKQNKKEFF